MSNHDYITGKVTGIEELQCIVRDAYRAGSPSIGPAIATLAHYRADPAVPGAHRAICNPQLKDTNYSYCPLCGVAK